MALPLPHGLRAGVRAARGTQPNGRPANRVQARVSTPHFTPGSAAPPPGFPDVLNTLISDGGKPGGRAQLSSTLGKPLSSAELDSLQSALSTLLPRLRTTGGLVGLRASLLAFLAECQDQRLELVEGSALLLEQVAQMSEQGEATPATGFSGRWQIVFSSGGTWPARLYFLPCVEELEVDGPVGSSKFTLTTHLGPISTTFSGAAHWEDGTLHYDATRMAMEVLGVSCDFGSTSLPQQGLKIIAMSKDTAVARSCSGALLLMTRP